MLSITTKLITYPLLHKYLLAVLDYYAMVVVAHWLAIEVVTLALAFDGGVNRHSVDA